jgi:uncharacterized protein (TIGR03435 family)
MMKMLLSVHIAGGTAALLSMLLPLVSPKGGRLHRRAGWVFVAGMTTVSITALVLAAHQFVRGASEGARAGGAFLLYIAILTGAGVSAGVRVLRAKHRTTRHHGNWDLSVATLLTAGAILLAAYGLAISQALLISFSIIGLINGGGQLAYWLRPPSAPMHWWYEHMNQMLGACIAATTAFLVNNAGRIGLPNTSLLVWLGPATVGVPAGMIWTRYYRRRFAERSDTRDSATRVAATAAIVLAVVALVVPMVVHAQAFVPGSAGDTFDVASVRPSTSGAQVPLPRILPDGQVRIVGVTLRDLIRLAYHSGRGQVIVEGGPAWIMADRFDVIAKTGGTAPSATMLRHLLESRFNLQARSLTRESNVFALVVARQDGRLGPSIKETTCAAADAVTAPAAFNESLERAMKGPAVPATDCSTFRIGAGPTFFAESVTMTRFAAILSEFPMLGGAPVVDRTGLTGTYTFQMRTRADNNPNPEAGVLMPVALEEQLGLKLERSTGLIDVVVVDQAQRPDVN